MRDKESFSEPKRKEIKLYVVRPEIGYGQCCGSKEKKRERKRGGERERERRSVVDPR